MRISTQEFSPRISLRSIGATHEARVQAAWCYGRPCPVDQRGVQMPTFIQTVAAGVRAIPGLVLTWLLRKGREVVIGAALGALLGFFWEDVDAWVRSRVQPG